MVGKLGVWTGWGGREGPCQAIVLDGALAGVAKDRLSIDERALL